jgi:RimJ/RimL family protein N-acetyltransferase
MDNAANTPNLVAETEHLRLRRFVDADAAFYREMLTDPDFINNIANRGIETVEQALANMRERVYASYEAHGFGMYLAERRSDGLAVGMAGLVKRDFLEDVDIGYAFLPAGRGQGLATEAAAAILDHARRDFSLHRVAAITAQDNIASIRVLEKLGFYRAGLVQFPDDGDICAHFLVDL